MMFYLINNCFQHQPSAGLVLSLSLSELTKQLQEEFLSPEDVFYSYMRKVCAGTKHVSVSKYMRLISSSF